MWVEAIEGVGPERRSYSKPSKLSFIKQAAPRTAGGCPGGGRGAGAPTGRTYVSLRDRVATRNGKQ